MSNEKPVGKSVSTPLAQKSKALYQRAIKNPAIHSVSLARKVGHNMDIARSKSIAHFTHHRPKVTSDNNRSAAPNKRMDIAPVRHPLAVKVDGIRTAAAKPVLTTQQKPKTSKDIKEEAITAALQSSSTRPPKKNSFLKRHFRFINIVSISLAIFIIIGCITYLNMPAISVRVANYQAGINATFPKYYPDGYAVNGPVTYSNGEVVINFKANAGNTKFSINQSKSTWDSSAVKNKVEKDSKGEFITVQEKGLTIYTYDGNAAWVNGNILYTITGDAPLSGDQIRRMATSL